jgi:hypothetical protein
MPHGRGRHAARRPRHHLVVVAAGLSFVAAVALLFTSGFIRVRHTAMPAAALGLDAQQRGTLDEVSRDQDRSPMAMAATPRPSYVQPVAGLSRAQMNHATTIVQVAIQRGLPRQAAVVAVVTALQETRLRNLANRAVPGSLAYPHDGLSDDLDSIGLFQQRMSQGWGTVAQLMDPAVAAGLFYNRLLKVTGWQTLSVADAAQAVQRSAYPTAYQQHERTAQRIVAAIAPTTW